MHPAPYNKPDLHAPRNREKIADFLAYPEKDHYGFFSRMKEQYPQMRVYTNREIAQWIRMYNEELAHQVITEKKGVELPEKLGVVLVGLCKPTEKTAANNIDYKTSSQLGLTIPHRNGNTEGYIAKIYYTTEVWGCRYKGHGLWKFKPCRALSRAVSSAIKNEVSYKKYITFTSKQSVSRLFSKLKKSNNPSRNSNDQEVKKKMFAEYDEFAFD